MVCAVERGLPVRHAQLEEAGSQATCVMCIVGLALLDVASQCALMR